MPCQPKTWNDNKITFPISDPAFSLAYAPNDSEWAETKHALHNKKSSSHIYLAIALLFLDQSITSEKPIKDIMTTDMAGGTPTRGS